MRLSDCKHWQKMMKNRVEQQRTKPKGYCNGIGNDEASCRAVKQCWRKSKSGHRNKIGVATNYNIPGDECEKIESGTIRVKVAEKWTNELSSISQSNWLTSCWVGICKAVGRRAVDWTTVSGDIEHSILFDCLSIRTVRFREFSLF